MNTTIIVTLIFITIFLWWLFKSKEKFIHETIQLEDEPIEEQSEHEFKDESVENECINESIDACHDDVLKEIKNPDANKPFANIGVNLSKTEIPASEKNKPIRNKNQKKKKKEI